MKKRSIKKQEPKEQTRARGTNKSRNGHLAPQLGAAAATSQPQQQLGGASWAFALALLALVLGGLHPQCLKVSKSDEKSIKKQHPMKSTRFHVKKAQDFWRANLVLSFFGQFLAAKHAGFGLSRNFF